MLEQLIEARLAPLLDRITQIEEGLESDARRGRNAIQLGTVSAVIGQRVVITVGKARTAPIKWFACAAGDVVECRYPSIGEMALVLNYGSCDRNSSAVAIVGIPSDQYPLPSTDKNRVIRKVGALGMEEWDKVTGKLTITAPGGITADTPLFECSGDVRDAKGTMAADRDIYNNHDHNTPRGISQKPNQKQ
ncbi:phage baseplate assembly protein V [Edwardsiella piscicida]|uniref:phage baseplate assembly protein V n=1 Tax=Edwardsiella piscicida TaxID=1263550 RepID=UPI000D51AF36|nr:phage baseplate assembly protein V [Edwardsiella piscicida]UCQ23071.1 phage baseplate assembly protein V [Edwardsiella piscicida]